MNVIPSRRVKGLLQIVDAVSTNAAKIYTEKKGAVETAEASEGGLVPESAQDFMSIFRAYHSITLSSGLYVA